MSSELFDKFCEFSIVDCVHCQERTAQGIDPGWYYRNTEHFDTFCASWGTRKQPATTTLDDLLVRPGVHSSENPWWLALPVPTLALALCRMGCARIFPRLSTPPLGIVRSQMFPKSMTWNEQLEEPRHQFHRFHQFQLIMRTPWASYNSLPWPSLEDRFLETASQQWEGSIGIKGSYLLCTRLIAIWWHNYHPVFRICRGKNL